MRFPLRRAALLIIRLLYIASLAAIYFVGQLTLYPEVNYYFWGYAVILLAYISFLLTFMGVFSAFKVGEQKLFVLIVSSFLAVLFSNALIYLTLSLVTYRMLSPFGILVISAIQGVLCLVGCFVMNKAYFALYPPWRVVAIVGDDPDDRITVLKMRTINNIYTITKLVDAASPLKDILAAIQESESVLVGTFDERKKRAVLDACYRMGKRINIIPSPIDVVMNNAAKTQIMDTPVLLCRNQEMSIEQAAVKRLSDILLSGIGLVLASPIMLVVAVAVKLTDGGPALFRQKRLTKGGRVFYMYKFRSMRQDAEKGLAPGQLLVARQDSRITPVGRVIRAIRLDELPQLWNILKGEMSLVGPRPERPVVYEQMREELPEFDLRLRMKAGLTGYAQIYGRYDTSLRDKLNLDLFYIERYSLLQDLNLLLMTLRVIFIKESSQGVELEEYGDLDDLENGEASP